MYHVPVRYALVLIPRWVGLLRVTHVVEMAVFYVLNDF